MVAATSTRTARLIAKRWSPPLVPAPNRGQARIKDNSATTAYQITEQIKSYDEVELSRSHSFKIETEMDAVLEARLGDRQRLTPQRLWRVAVGTRRGASQ